MAKIGKNEIVQINTNGGVWSVTRNGKVLKCGTEKNDTKAYDAAQKWVKENREK